MLLTLPEMCQARLCPSETAHKLASARCGRAAPEESRGDPINYSDADEGDVVPVLSAPLGCQVPVPES